MRRIALMVDETKYNAFVSFVNNLDFAEIAQDVSGVEEPSPLAIYQRADADKEIQSEEEFYQVLMKHIADYFKNPKRKVDIAKYRGAMTKQPTDMVDDQLNKLRNGWG